MAKPFSEYTYEDAHQLFKPVKGDTPDATDKVRRPDTAIKATLFHAGDHWQNGHGFNGQLPPTSYPGAKTIKDDIKKRFESENAIKSVIETHRDGVLGREPLWSFLPAAGKKKTTRTVVPEGDQENAPASFEETTAETLTPWWNDREALTDLQKTADILTLEGIAVRRLFFPKGRLPESGELTAPNLPAALDFLFFETLHADVAGVFTDPETQKQIGVYLFEETDADGGVISSCAELSYLDDLGNTACRVVRDKGEPEEFGPFRLGGRLLLHEVRRAPLITEAVQSIQKALNLAQTMMTRNVCMAGARERTISNAQPPKRKRRIQSAADPDKTVDVLESATYDTGGGAVMFLMGYPKYGADRTIIGYTEPSVDISDPASVEVFVQTRATKREAILSQCHQEHILITGDATASGVSRKQAEKGFQRSLKETKTPLDASGRWQLEASLRMAAQILGESEKYLGLRADFNCLLDVGEPEPDDRRVVMEMRKPGGASNTPLISDETARNMVGIDDAAAELARIEAEKPEERVAPTPVPAAAPEEGS